MLRKHYNLSGGKRGRAHNRHIKNGEEVESISFDEDRLCARADAAGFN